MDDACCSGPVEQAADPRARPALWVALGLNALMCVVELGASWSSGSVSLMADAVDFAGDAANYGLSLFVLARARATRAKAAVFKAACMAAFGIAVLGRALHAALDGALPEAFTMGAVGFAALAVNAGVALLLYRFRAGEANLRSAWICSRNDTLGNLAVMAAALGVFGTASAWPDLLVAGAMAALAVGGATSVLRQARRELRGAASGGR